MHSHPTLSPWLAQQRQKSFASCIWVSAWTHGMIFDTQTEVLGRFSYYLRREGASI
jgi:hypothetical protein